MTISICNFIFLFFFIVTIYWIYFPFIIFWLIPYAYRVPFSLMTNASRTPNRSRPMRHKCWHFAHVTLRTNAIKLNQFNSYFISFLFFPFVNWFQMKFFINSCNTYPFLSSWNLSNLFWFCSTFVFYPFLEETLRFYCIGSWLREKNIISEIEILFSEKIE